MPKLNLYLGAHRVLLALIAATVVSFVAGVTDGRSVSVPQLMEQYLRTVPVRPFLAVVHASLVLWTLPRETLLTEANSQRSLTVADAILVATLAMPPLVCAAIAILVHDEKFAAGWLTDCGAAVTLALGAAALIGVTRASILPPIGVLILAAFSGSHRIAASPLPFVGRVSVVAAVVATVASLSSSLLIRIVRRRIVLGLR